MPAREPVAGIVAVGEETKAQGGATILLQRFGRIDDGDGVAEMRWPCPRARRQQHHAGDEVGTIARKGAGDPGSIGVTGDDRPGVRRAFGLDHGGEIPGEVVEVDARHRAAGRLDPPWFGPSDTEAVPLEGMRDGPEFGAGPAGRGDQEHERAGPADAVADRAARYGEDAKAIGVVVRCHIRSPAKCD